MKCGKCSKKFSTFYTPTDEFECPKCKSIVKCDMQSYMKLFSLFFLILFILGLFEMSSLTFIILSIIISVPFFYKYVHMECRVVKEGRIEEKEVHKGD